MLEPGGACRLVFSESDGLPGLIVDRYGDYLVCQFLSAGAESWRSTIVELLAELCSPRGIYERSEGGGRHKEGLASRRGVLAGVEPPREVEVVAGNVRLVVDIANGQKTGAYLDQQRNRERVAAHGRNAEVLDAFSYTGGFAIVCLARRREDARRWSIPRPRRWRSRSARRPPTASATAAASWWRTCSTSSDRCGSRARSSTSSCSIRRNSSTRRIRSTAGSRGYKDINMLGLALVRPGGVLATFSCSGHVDAALFQKIVAGAAVDAGRTAQILERLAQPADHPIATEFPEADYLKGLILRVH